MLVSTKRKAAQQAFCSRPIAARFMSQGSVSFDGVFRRLKMGVGLFAGKAKNQNEVKRKDFRVLSGPHESKRRVLHPAAGILSEPGKPGRCWLFSDGGVLMGPGDPFGGGLSPPVRISRGVARAGGRRETETWRPAVGFPETNCLVWAERLATVSGFEWTD
jgi:hypothetical protein